MKKLFAIIVIATLFSCKKEVAPLQSSDSLPSSVANSLTSKEAIAEFHGNSSVSFNYFDFRVFNCTSSEWIHVTGTVRYSVTRNDTGNPAFRYTANYQGVNGYGETSGVQYHGMGVQVGVLNLVSGSTGTYTGTFLQNFRFVATSGDKWIFDVLSHVTIDPNNKLVVLFDKEVLTCDIPQ